MQTSRLHSPPSSAAFDGYSMHFVDSVFLCVCVLCMWNRLTCAHFGVRVCKNNNPPTSVFKNKSEIRLTASTLKQDLCIRDRVTQNLHVLYCPIKIWMFCIVPLKLAYFLTVCDKISLFIVHAEIIHRHVSLVYTLCNIKL